MGEDKREGQEKASNSEGRSSEWGIVLFLVAITLGILGILAWVLSSALK